MLRCTGGDVKIREIYQFGGGSSEQLSPDTEVFVGFLDRFFSSRRNAGARQPLKESARYLQPVAPVQPAKTLTPTSGPLASNPLGVYRSETCGECGGAGWRATFEGGNRNAYLRHAQRVPCMKCHGTGEQKVSIFDAGGSGTTSDDWVRQACKAGVHSYLRFGATNFIEVSEVCVVCGEPFRHDKSRKDQQLDGSGRAPNQDLGPDRFKL